MMTIEEEEKEEVLFIFPTNNDIVPLTGKSKKAKKKKRINKKIKIQT